MTTLPTEVEYGYVVGRFLIAQADGTDVGRLPDAVAAAGTVKIAPKDTVHRTSAQPATIVRAPITCTVAQNGDGWMVDERGAAGVWLAVGHYRVSFIFQNASVDPFDIEVTAAHTDVAPLDLTLAAPLIPSPTVQFVVNEQIYLDTLAARDEAIAAAGGGVTSWAEIAALPDLPATFPPTIGATATTAVAGNDARLTDTRTPTDGSVTTAKIADGAVTAAKTTGLVPATRTVAGKALSANVSLVSADLTDFTTAVDARVANIVGAAPTALDTLVELSTALGDDPNFAATVTATLATKASTSAAVMRTWGIRPRIYADSATTVPNRVAWIAANAPGYTGPVTWDLTLYLDHPGVPLAQLAVGDDVMDRVS